MAAIVNRLGNRVWVVRACARIELRESRRKQRSGRPNTMAGATARIRGEPRSRSRRRSRRLPATSRSTSRAVPPPSGRQRNISVDVLRDMAALDVLRPEQEFTSAREIEALEIAVWEAVLAHAPAIEHVLASIEPIAPLPGEAKVLRAEPPSAARHRTPRATASSIPRPGPSWPRGLRASCDPRMSITCSSTPHSARSTASRWASAPAVARSRRSQRARAQGLAAPRPCSQPRRRRCAQRVRQGEPAPRGIDRAPVQSRPDGARRSDPGRQPRPHQGGRALRLSPRISVLDLRELVDPSRDQPRAGRQGSEVRLPVT